MKTGNQFKQVALRGRLWAPAAMLALSLVALVVAAVLLARQASDVRDATFLQARLAQAEESVGATLLALTDAEAGERGYLLTGNDHYLRPYRTGVDNVARSLDELDSLATVEPSLAMRIRDIREQSNLKLAEMEQSIRLYDDVSPAAAVALVQTDAGRRYMVMLHTDMSAVTAFIHASRKAANQHIVAGTRSTQRWAAITATILVLVGLFAALQIRMLVKSQHRHATELKDLTAVLNAVIEATPAGVAVWDMGLRYQLVNTTFERWNGRGREHFIGRTFLEALGDVEYQRSRPWLERALAGETVIYEKDFPNGLVSRNIQVTYTPLRLQDRSMVGLIAVAQDITHHREENLRLRSLSESDPLTGLLNRSGFEVHLMTMTKRGESAQLAALCIDLDYFKPVNDQYGHAAGDDVLRQFAARLQSIARPADAVARLGGDEFAMVLGGVRDPASALIVAEKVVGLARQPFTVGDRQVTIAASVGVAVNAEATGGWRRLLTDADAMTYVAKSRGRNQAAITTGPIGQPGLQRVS